MVSRLSLLGVAGPPPSAPPPGGFTPADVYGLERWYYQPDLDYAAGTWVDRAAVALNLTQATGSKQPTLSAALAELNSKYGVVFDGSSDIISTSAFTVAQPFTIATLLRQVSWTANDFLWDLNSGAGGALIQRTATPRLTVYAGSDGPFTTVLPVGRFGHIVAKVNNTVSVLQQDGASQNSPATAGANTVAALYLGAAAGESAWGNVEFSEFLLYRGVVGTYDLVRLWNEWIAADRYNIPVTFDPTSIVGLQAWYKADSEAYANGDAVGTVTDRSGNGRNATSTGADRPTFSAKHLNGRSAYTFAGAQFSKTAPFTLNNGCTLIVVARVLGTAAYAYITDGNADNTFAITKAGASTWKMQAGDGISGGTADLNPHILVGVFNGAASYIVQDGVQGATVTSSGTPGGLTLGRPATSLSSYLTGDIYEVLVYNSVLTTVQRQQVEGYLANKYSINAAIRPFDPLAIAGCKGWYDAANTSQTVDGSAVATWYDKSGMGNHMSQATGTNQPTYRATGGPNSKPAVETDGIDNFMSGAISGGFSVSTCIVVMKMLAWVSDGIPVSLHTSAGGSAIWMRTATPTLAMYSGGAYTPARSDWQVNQWGVGSFVFNGASSRFDLDGNTGTAANPGTAAGDRVAIGGYTAAANLANIQIAEIILYTSVLSDADLSSVEAYIAKKYDIAYKAPDHSSLVANLALWLDSSQITPVADGTALSQWDDMSGNSRHAVQATGTNQPTYQTLEQNGRPAVRFDGVDNFMKTPAFAISQPVTSFIVMKRTTVGASEYIVHYTETAAGAAAELYNAAAGNDLKLYAGTAEVTVTGKTVTAIYSLLINGATSRGFTDGVGGTAGNAGTRGVNGITLAATSTPGSYSDVDIFEVIIFNALLSDADRRAVENWLSQKYNIAV